MKYLLFILVCFCSLSLNAQTSPVKWTFKLKKLDNQKSEFIAIADINKGWNIYSVYMEEDGPIPTSFTFSEVINGSLEGKIIEKSNKISVFDELFEMQVIKFKEIAEFSQIFSGEAGLSLKGNVIFMCCDSKRCLPPATVPFDLKLN